jgi:hypothetical protein
MKSILKNILLTGEYKKDFKMFSVPKDSAVFEKGAKQVLHIKANKIEFKINSGTKLYKEVYKLLWERLGNTLVNEANEIEEDYLFFNIGDDTDMIWHWFEDFFDISIGKDILNQ